MTTPIEVPCTYCRSLPGTPCPRRQPHAVRVKLAAQPAPDWHDGFPVAVPILVTSTQVKVRCPICGLTHWHGWAADMDENESHRVAHCHVRSGPLGYFIAPTKDTEREQA